MCMFYCRFGPHATGLENSIPQQLKNINWFTVKQRVAKMHPAGPVWNLAKMTIVMEQTTSPQYLLAPSGGTY